MCKQLGCNAATRSIVTCLLALASIDGVATLRERVDYTETRSSSTNTTSGWHTQYAQDVSNSGTVQGNMFVGLKQSAPYVSSYASGNQAIHDVEMMNAASLNEDLATGKATGYFVMYSSRQRKYFMFWAEPISAQANAVRRSFDTYQSEPPSLKRTGAVRRK